MLDSMLRLQPVDSPAASLHVDAADNGATAAARELGVPDVEVCCTQVDAWNNGVDAALQHAGVQACLEEMDDRGASCHMLSVAVTRLCASRLFGALQFWRSYPLCALRMCACSAALDHL